MQLFNDVKIERLQEDSKNFPRIYKVQQAVKLKMICGDIVRRNSTVISREMSRWISVPLVSMRFSFIFRFARTLGQYVRTR